MHLKRESVPKTWPIPRKGTKYIVVPMEEGLPVLIAIRDMLKMASDRKEAKMILHSKEVFVNNKRISDEKLVLKLFDVLKLKDKNYRLTVKNKKYSLEEISAKEAKEKIAKIIGQTLQKGKKIQLNLDDGGNYLVKEKAKTGDSALVVFGEGIKKIITLKEKSKVFIKKGKHIGKIGAIEKITENLAEIKVDGEKINVNLESLIALE